MQYPHIQKPGSAWHRQRICLAGIVLFSCFWTWTARAEGAAPPVAAIRVLENPTGGVWFEWTRAAGPERMTGWHLERQQPDGRFIRLTETRVDPGLFDPPDSVYRIHDATARVPAGNRITCRLVIVDLELQEWPTADAACEVEHATAEFRSEPGTGSADAFPETASPASVRAAQGNRMRIVLKTNGLYRLTAGQIASVFAGYTEQQAAQGIVQTNFVLSCGGTSVAWRAEADGAALLFFGQAYRDMYTDRNVYWLESGPGLAMPIRNGVTSETAVDPWFWETARAEHNDYYRPFLTGAVEDDYFIWSGQLITTPQTSWQWTTNVPLTDLHPVARQGVVTAHLIGDTEPAYTNHTRLYAGGELLDDRLWPGRGRLAQSGGYTNLSGTSVTIRIEFQRELNIPSILVYIDALDVRYARRMLARNNSLLFQPEAGTNLLTVRGFSSSAIRVFDVQDPLRPVEVVATIAPDDASWRVSWTTNVGTGSWFLATATTWLPERIEGVTDAGWDGPMTGAPHLVIASQAMTNTAAALVAHRVQHGLDSLLVPVEELNDAFAFGRRDPRAIIRFLAQARTNWTVPPAYVCLAGDGHVDYYDNFGQASTRPNHLPPILEQIYDGREGVHMVLGLDNPLADTDGDGTPNCAIGRLPAQTTNALARMIERIIAHESRDDWKTNALFIADYDVNHDFQMACERLATRAPPAIAPVHLNRTGTTLEPMRTDFLKALNSSVPLAVYLGHGNNIALGDGSWFFRHTASTSDMAGLTNRIRGPLLLAGTCLLNNFSKPALTDRCIGKGFLETAPGGAVAVWASATEATLSVSEDTTRIILDELYQDSEALLGDLIRAALEAERQSPYPWLVGTSVLLGDPGMGIRTGLAADQIPPGIQIMSPTSASCFAAGTNFLDLGGICSDSNGIWKVWVRNSRVAGEFPATGTTHWSVTGLPLSEGTNLLTAMAMDSAGNSATAALEVVWGMMPPVISIASPTNGPVFTTVAGHVNVAGLATDYSGVAQVIVWNNRIAEEIRANGTTNWSVAGLPLAEGTNLISVVAADVFGNSATADIQVVNTGVWNSSETPIADIRRLTAGLELTWDSMSNELYCVKWTTSLLEDFEPLEPFILATSSIVNVTLPLDLAKPQMYFQLIRVFDEEP